MLYINPKNPEQSIESALSATEARDIIRANYQPLSQFHQSLMMVNLSPAQKYWLFRIAEDKKNGVTEKKESIPLAKIAAMFASAKTHLKFPKIRLMNGNSEVVISLAPEGGNNPGALYVKVGGEYAGKITASGEWHPRNNAGDLTGFLREFAENPRAGAIKYGRLTGNCCFCHRTLTADNSLEVGYGPICAGRFGLPWGE